MQSCGATAREISRCRQRSIKCFATNPIQTTIDRIDPRDALGFIADVRRSARVRSTLGSYSGIGIGKRERVRDIGIFFSANLDVRVDEIIQRFPLLLRA